MSAYWDLFKQGINPFSGTVPQFSAISVSSSGDNTIVAGVPSKQIRVLGYDLVCAGAVVVTWKSSTAGAISGPKSFAANGGESKPESITGLLQTAVGEGLVLNLGGNVSVGGELTYVLI